MAWFVIYKKGDRDERTIAAKDAAEAAVIARERYGATARVAYEIRKPDGAADTPVAGIAERITAAVEAKDWGTPGAVKRGNDPRWPYVGIIKLNGRTRNPLGRRAYATREEAIAAVKAHIEHLKATEREKLAEPRYRALRETYGLPSEI